MMRRLPPPRPNLQQGNGKGEARQLCLRAIRRPGEKEAGGGSFPRPTGLTAAGAKFAAGNLAGAAAVGLQGQGAETAAGELTENVLPISTPSSLKTQTTVIPAAQEPAAVSSARSLAAPLVIRPTIHPMAPGDTVTVEDPVSIDVDSTGFRDFVATMDRLTEAIRQSNVMAQETRQQMIAELKAGVEYLKASKPSRKVLELLLIVPLTAATTIAASTVVQEAAKLAFKALLKLISLDLDLPL